MQITRGIIRAADSRVTQSIRWSAPAFASRGNLAGFQPRAKPFVSLMFHRGSEIRRRHSRQEGAAPRARIMRFSDLADV